jgi:hypothetical protein
MSPKDPCVKGLVPVNSSIERWWKKSEAGLNWRKLGDWEYALPGDLGRSQPSPPPPQPLPTPSPPPSLFLYVLNML